SSAVCFPVRRRPAVPTLVPYTTLFRSDVAAVWAALAEGTLDTVGTDHIPHPRAAKLAPGLSFDRIPPGVANLETLLPMLYSEGRSEEHTSELQSLAYLVCRLLLEKKKG